MLDVSDCSRLHNGHHVLCLARGSRRHWRGSGDASVQARWHAPLRLLTELHFRSVDQLTYLLTCTELHFRSLKQLTYLLTCTELHFRSLKQLTYLLTYLISFNGVICTRQTSILKHLEGTNLALVAEVFQVKLHVTLTFWSSLLERFTPNRLWLKQY